MPLSASEVKRKSAEIFSLLQGSEGDLVSAMAKNMLAAVRIDKKASELDPSVAEFEIGPSITCLQACLLFMSVTGSYNTTLEPLYTGQKALEVIISGNVDSEALDAIGVNEEQLENYRSALGKLKELNAGLGIADEIPPLPNR